jgi:hypothetical protein
MSLQEIDNFMLSDNLSLIFFSGTGYISAVTAFMLGCYILIKNKSDIVNQTAFLLTISTAIWSLGLAAEVISLTRESALFWSRFLHSGVIFIPVIYFHFISALLGCHKDKILFIKIGYVTAFILLLFNTKGLVVADVKPKSFFNYYTEPGVLYSLLLFTFFVFTIYGFILLLKKVKQSKGHKKNQFLYISFASIIGFSGGSLTYLPVFNIDSQLVLIGQLIFIFYPVLIVYAIVKHRLMDIEIIIRETTIFAGIFGFSIGLFILAIAAGEQVLQPYIGQSKWIIPAVSLFIVTFAIRPIEKFVYGVVGKYLFRKKFEYQKTLHDAAEGMSKVRNPRKLLNLIVHIISAKLRLEGVAILLYDNSKGRYEMKASRGGIKDKLMILSPENSLIQWLSEKKNPLTLEEVQKWISSDLAKRSPGMLVFDLEQIKDTMQDLRAAVCVPCFFRDEFLGILVLGDKQSGDFFSQDDLSLFSALSNEAAIALKNSQLYFEIDKKARETEALYEREHKLFMHASVAFAAAVDARDPYTHGHSQRVTNISLAILDYAEVIEEVGKNVFFRQRLQITGVLHDIGKIGVPDDILHKPSKLTSSERRQIEKHPVVGADIISHIKGLRDLIGGIKYHHERYDGKGYPEGLKSEDIPLMARIIAVADTYDAMTSDRPYRKGLPALMAKEEIQRNASTQFDPYLVAAFLKAFEQGKVK